MADYVGAAQADMLVLGMGTERRRYLVAGAGGWIIQR